MKEVGTYTFTLQPSPFQTEERTLYEIMMMMKVKHMRDICLKYTEILKYTTTTTLCVY